MAETMLLKKTTLDRVAVGTYIEYATTGLEGERIVELAGVITNMATEEMTCHDGRPHTTVWVTVDGGKKMGFSPRNPIEVGA